MFIRLMDEGNMHLPLERSQCTYILKMKRQKKLREEYLSISDQIETEHLRIVVMIVVSKVHDSLSPV